MKKILFIVPFMAISLFGCNKEPSIWDKQEFFRKDSWENLIKNAENGLSGLKKAYGLNTFIGLEKKFKTDEGTEEESDYNFVRVIGENHDTLSDGTHNLASLTFMMLSPHFVDGKWDQTSNVNYSKSTVNTYINSDEYTKGFEAKMLSGIKAVWKPITFKGSGNEWKPMSYSTKMFLLSFTEVYGESATLEEGDLEFAPTEGYKYDWFNAEKTEMKEKRKLTGKYWLRTPYTKDTSKAWIVDDSGGIDKHIVTDYIGYYYHPCFCI